MSGAQHVPVLLERVLDLLAPSVTGDRPVVVDATLGLGGHTEAMLTRFDDYPIHQTPEPVAQPYSGDRNFYDRYFFNGYAKDGSCFFAAAMGLYPNRRVMDASFSVVAGGRQWALRASRLAPSERTETTVGPITVTVIVVPLVSTSNRANL